MHFYITLVESVECSDFDTWANLSTINDLVQGNSKQYSIIDIQIFCDILHCCLNTCHVWLHESKHRISSMKNPMLWFMFMLNIT